MHSLKYSYAFLVLVGFCFTDLAYADNQEQQKALHLQEAIALALQHNRAIKRLYLNRVVERFALKVAKREFLPTASVSASATQNNSLGSRLTAGIVGEVSLKVATGGALSVQAIQPINQGASQLNLQFDQPLLKGAGLAINREFQNSAQRIEEKNILQLRRTLIDSITNVILSYRRFVLAQQSLAISRRSLQRTQQRLHKQRIFLQVGRVSKRDVLQAESSFTQQQLSFKRASNQFDQQRINLLQRLGMDYQLSIKPKVDIMVKEVSLDVSYLQQQARQNQPDYLLQLITIEDVKTQLTLAEDNNLWDLRLTSNYRLSSNTLGNTTALANRQGKYSIGLSLNIPFWDLTREQRVIQAQVAQEQLNLAIQQSNDDLNITIQNAVGDIQLLWEEIQLATLSKSLAKQQLDAEITLFGFKKSESLQIRLAEDALIQAENAEVRAKINYLNALSDLDRIVGITLERWHIDVLTRRIVQESSS